MVTILCAQEQNILHARTFQGSLVDPFSNFPPDCIRFRSREKTFWTIAPCKSILLFFERLFGECSILDKGLSINYVTLFLAVLAVFPPPPPPPNPNNSIIYMLQRYTFLSRKL